MKILQFVPMLVSRIGEVMPKSIVVDQYIAEYQPLAEQVRNFASVGEPTRERHDLALADIPAFACLEVQSFETNDDVTEFKKNHISVLAWNAERLKFDLPSRALVGAVYPDIGLLTEIDIGMARSRNRHTLYDLARPLGYNYVYAVEFAELGLGDDREQEWHRGEENSHGYHGNAIISRHPLLDPFAVRLDDGAYWFLGHTAADQRRIGFRNAVGARIKVNESSLWCVSAHLENRTTPQGRADQTERLLDAITRRCGNDPVVIGGDFNTLALPTNKTELEAVFSDPSHIEPLFALFKQAGFTWTTTNQCDPTCRTRPDGTPSPPFTRIDWIFVRGLTGFDSATLPAVDAEGSAISDHDAIRTSLSLHPTRAAHATTGTSS